MMIKSMFYKSFAKDSPARKDVGDHPTP